jgi:hypothetical protein
MTPTRREILQAAGLRMDATTRTPPTPPEVDHSSYVVDVAHWYMIQLDEDLEVTVHWIELVTWDLRPGQVFRVHGSIHLYVAIGEPGGKMFGLPYQTGTQCAVEWPRLETGQIHVEPVQVIEPGLTPPP